MVMLRVVHPMAARRRSDVAVACRHRIHVGQRMRASQASRRNAALAAPLPAPLLRGDMTHVIFGVGATQGERGYAFSPPNWYPELSPIEWDFRRKGFLSSFNCRKIPWRELRSLSQNWERGFDVGWLANVTREIMRPCEEMFNAATYENALPLKDYVLISLKNDLSCQEFFFLI